MQKTMNVRELASAWNMTERRVAQMCANGEISGAIKSKGQWQIPADTQRPESSHRKKQTVEVANQTDRQLPCAVGITSYKEISSECYYVDKTLLIRDLIDDHHKVYLFTRPRRFGKTLTMDMIKTFFENTREDNSIHFRNKQIWECGPFYQKEQGQYPVISLSFKDARQNTWEEIYQHICLILRGEYHRHAELLDSDRLMPDEKAFFHRILNMQATKAECEIAIGELCRMLSGYYQTQVIIIIDEYDTPIQQGYLNGCYQQVIGFMRNLFSSSLKDQEHLRFGVMTGILRVAKESLFSGLNNLVVNSILDEKYASYFGFTENDVEAMAAYYHREDKMDEIREWYDGYRFGSYDIYNPWSVANYFSNDCKPKAFWSHTSSNDVIGELLRNADAETTQSLIRLMQGDSIHALVDTDIIYPKIDEHADAIFSFLLISGYLKIAEILQETDNCQLCSLVLPNKEIRGVFRHEILSNQNQLFPSSVVRAFQLALLNSDERQLSRIIQQFLMNSVSCFDTAHEAFYHGMMLGLLAIMADQYHIRSNRESGEGRFDLMLEPVKKDLPGILMEFKARKNISGNVLQALARSGIDQIIENKYAADLFDRDIRRVMLFGIAFSGKQVEIATDMLYRESEFADYAGDSR